MAMDKIGRFFTRWIPFFAIGAVVLLGGCAGPPAAATIPLEKCRLPDDLPGRCGALSVPENRENQSGRILELNFVVLPATTNRIAGDPLFLLAGGPGQPAISVYPPLIPLFDKLRETRDIILLDQRGTGRSAPLDCPQLTEIDATIESEEEILAEIKDCVADLSTGRDLTRYATEDAVQDLDDVRQALGYQTINIYGSSYGSRAALAYAQTFPERVRALVLDAVAGPELVLYLQMPRDGQRSLDLLQTRCESDPACREYFPDFAAELAAIHDRLAEPRQVTVNHPSTGQLIELQLTQEQFSQMIFNLLYSPELVSLLPLLVHQTFVQDDYSRMLALAITFSEGNEINLPLLYAVVCSEDAPLIDLSEARALWESGTDFFGFNAESFLEVCALWPSREPDPAWRATAAIQAPTLLLSGEGDPVTPPIYAAELAADLPQSLHLIVPFGGHGSLTNHCISNLVIDFIEKGSLTGLATNCVGEMTPPPFFIDFNGPMP